MALERRRQLSPNRSSRGGSAVRLIILHTAEGALTIESLGSFFSNPASQVSSHTGIDDKPGVIGEYVPRNEKAWTAANANPYGVQTELCAFAKWTPAEWAKHPQMLANCAAWIAEEAAAFGIPIVRLTAAQAQGGGRGVCQHVDLGSAGGGHWDCGPGFPMDQVIAMAQGGAPAPSPPPTPTPTPPTPAPPPEEDKDMIICSTPTGKGYIAVGPDGSVYAYGDAKYKGGANTGGGPDKKAPVLPAGDRITDAAYAGDGSGYWLISKGKGIYAYGAAYLGGPNET